MLANVYLGVRDGAVEERGEHMSAGERIRRQWVTHAEASPALDLPVCSRACLSPRRGGASQGPPFTASDGTSSLSRSISTGTPTGVHLRWRAGLGWPCSRRPLPSSASRRARPGRTHHRSADRPSQVAPAHNDRVPAPASGHARACAGSGPSPEHLRDEDFPAGRYRQYPVITNTVRDSERTTTKEEE
jgi:hypothetical protein